MVITMAKLCMVHASTHGARKPPGPKKNNLMKRWKQSDKVGQMLNANVLLDRELEDLVERLDEAGGAAAARIELNQKKERLNFKSFKIRLSESETEIGPNR